MSACLPFHLLPDTVDFHAYDKHLLHHNNQVYIILWLSLFNYKSAPDLPTKENALLFALLPSHMYGLCLKLLREEKFHPALATLNIDEHIQEKRNRERET